jgi:peptide chain release factor 2
VDIDPSVISLLLRTGYSTAFGARPLKRTVERFVLLPMARAISSGQVPPGSVLRLVAKGDHVEVAVVPPESEVPVDEAQVPAIEDIGARTAELRERVDGQASRAEPLAERKTALVARTAEGGFWSDRTSALGAMDEIHRLEGVLGARDRLERRLAGYERWLAERPPAGEWVKRAAERLVKIEEEAARVDFLLSCRDARDLGDAIVAVTLVKSSGEGLDGVERIARMYAGLARRRGLDVTVLDDRRGGEPFEDTVALEIDGAGAYGLLAGEAGLHHVMRTVATKKKPVRETDVVRVEVLAASSEQPDPPKKELKVEVTALRGEAGRVGPKPRTEVRLLHVPTMTSVHAWTDADADSAAERVLPLLVARRRQAEESREAAGENPVIRQYTLGPAPKVKDRRTGRSTPRLERVLEGDLDLFLRG